MFNDAGISNSNVATILVGAINVIMTLISVGSFGSFLKTHSSLVYRNYAIINIFL